MVTNPANVSYLSGFHASESYLLISLGKDFFITDFRYIEEARVLVKGFSFAQINSSLFKSIADLINSLDIESVAFEAKSMSFAEHQKIKKGIKAKIALIPEFDLVEELRQIKYPDEIKKIRQAIKIATEALKFVKNSIEPGIKERHLAAELEKFIRLRGGDAAAFELIVASGASSAFPHTRPKDAPISDNAPLLVDLGVDFEGYKSDLTRTFFLGKITPLFKKSYDIVRQAQELAIAGIKPGVPAVKIDRIARDFIIKKCGRDLLGHSLGHGVGLEVHEAPAISSKNNDLLQEGMVFTVEPAVYLKGKFGIRIEDMVLVTKKGCEILSDSRD